MKTLNTAELEREAMNLDCKACGGESPAEQFGSNTYYHRCRYCGFTAVVTLKEETAK